MVDISNRQAIVPETGVVVEQVPIIPDPALITRSLLLIGTGEVDGPPADWEGTLLNTLMLHKVDSLDELQLLVHPGSDLDRMYRAAARSGSVSTYIIRQSVETTAVAATATVTLDADVKAGTTTYYVGGYRLQTTFAADTEKNAASTMIADTISRHVGLSQVLTVTSANDAATIVFTAKVKGTWGNGVSFSFAGRRGDPPDTTTAAFTGGVGSLASGANDPDITAALEVLGTGDGANRSNGETYITDMVHAYGIGSIQKVYDYIGNYKNNTGLFKAEVSRPIRCLYGWTGTGRPDKDTKLILTDREDSSQGIIVVPGSATHPIEIASQACAAAAVLQHERPQRALINYAMSGVDRGDGNLWNRDSSVRDDVLRLGYSTTYISNGLVTIDRLVTFYRPPGISEDSLMFRFWRNVCLYQNMAENAHRAFNTPYWNGSYITSTNLTLSPGAPANADRRTVADVIFTYEALITAFRDFGFLYDTDESFAALHNEELLRTRANGTGFNATVPFRLSGIGGISFTKFQLTTNLGNTAT